MLKLKGSPQKYLDKLYHLPANRLLSLISLLSRIAAMRLILRNQECMPVVRQSCRLRKVESRTCLQIVHVNRT